MELPAVDTVLKSKVLQTIQHEPLRPTDLVSCLRKEAPQMEIESALSDLLDDGTVVFGSDRLLRSILVAAH
jgi:hypothetical protein